MKTVLISSFITVNSCKIKNAITKSLLIPLFCILLFNQQASAQDYCLNFDGSDDYVSISPMPAFNSTMTIEAWIKIVKPVGYSIAEPNIVSWGADANSVEFRLGFSGSNATLQFGIDATGSGGGAWQAIYGSTNLNTGNWVHVAVVKNGTTSTLYINGVSETSGTISRSPSLSNCEIGTLWEHGGIQNRYFPGLIDEVRLWNTARSQSDIQSTMTTVLSGSETGLQNYYKMTNGSGTTLTDNKGSSNGTIHSATWQTPGVPLLPVTVYVGGAYATCYATLKAAFDAINAGTHKGVIELKITGSTTETSTAVLNYSGSGSASFTSVNIYPTVTGLSISGNLASPLIDLNGADNVTIDGRVNATGSTKDMIINNTSTSGNGGTSTIRLYRSANSNTIKYCTIKGSTTDGSGGVIFLSATSASTGNTIDNNNITSSSNANRPVNTIYSGGAANTVTISNNYMYDFLNPGNNSNGINLNTSTGASTISGNSFYETTTFVPTNGGTFYPIYINTDAAGFTISGNYIGGSSANCGGTWTKTNAMFNKFYGICINSLGTGTPTVIKGNTINGFSWSNSNNHDWMGGISIGAGDVTLGVSGEPNTIGSISGTPKMTFNYDGSGSLFIAFFLSGSGYIDCRYNNIGGITCNNTDPTHNTRVYGIYRQNSNSSGIISNNTIGSSTNPISCTSPSTADWQYLVGILIDQDATAGLTISNNNISYLNNGNTGSSGYVSGIHSYYRNAPFTISGNNIHDLTIANTITSGGNLASVNGIYVTTAYLVTITNNTIYNLINTNGTFTGQLYGINCSAGNGANDISGNTIYNISATGTGAGPLIYGINFNASTGAENTITRNFIYGLSSSGVNTNYNNTKYYGIYKNNNCLATITNNILSLGGNNVSNIFGIYERGSSGCNTSLYFNTVYISGSPTSGNLTSYALYSENNTNTRNFRNNIFMNERSNAGNHYAMYIVSSGGSLTCDYNDYIVTGTNGKLGYYNGLDKSALPIVTGVTGNDANSLNTNPLFPSPKANGTLPGDFKPGVNLHGVAGTGITIDFTGYTRPSPPTLGIYEINNPLPVTLSSFTSVVNTRNVKLNWVTASEINNAGFEIQRAAIRQQSTDNWDKIGFVSGKGTTNSQTSYTFSDTKLNSGKYKYRLKQIDNNGNYEYHNLNGEVEVGVPAKYELSQNYPNPFNPTTKIDFSLPADSKIKLVVYDLTGREIKYLVNEIRTAGYYTAMFDASLLSSGIYFYRFIANANGKDFISTKKMILLK